ncbi:MAG: tyrosine-type recombinase/integrase [Rhodospirillales bacterium]|nr:tyrosine-type recombinase/integrase [Rhodospirillales bacterium]
MTLFEATEAYITLRRSLGAVFSSDARILRSFARTLGDIPVQGIDPKMAQAFCRGTGPPTPWWERKDGSLRGFFAWLVSRGHLAACPLPSQRPRVRRSFTPKIYSREELQRILDATEILQDRRYPLWQSTVRTLLLVLYGAGLRPGEGLRMRWCDVDLGERVLSINNTKFFMSRLVPIGAALADALSEYSSERRDLPMPAGVHSAFFATSEGLPISLRQLESAFARLRKHADVHGPPGSCRKPRLHDARHTFAVHRLVAWYREGVDVQACLPLLSTYLGHVNLSGTQAYLPMTPDLLEEASQRFARYARIDEKETNNA